MYIAKKKCKFKGRAFFIDEHIPDGYVLAEAATRLIRLGVIAEVPEGPLLPSEPSIEEQEAKMEEIPAAAEDLMKKKRGELIELADAAGLEVAENDTKKDIVEALLRAGSEGSEV